MASCLTVSAVTAGVYRHRSSSAASLSSAPSEWIRVMSCEDECRCDLTNELGLVRIVEPKNGQRVSVSPAHLREHYERVSEDFLVGARLCGECLIPMITKENRITGARFHCCPSYQLALNNGVRECQFPTVKTSQPDDKILEMETRRVEDSWNWLVARTTKSTEGIPKWAKELLVATGLDISKVGEGLEYSGKLLNCAHGRSKQQVCIKSRGCIEV